MSGIAMLIGYTFMVIGGFYLLTVVGTYMLDRIITRAKLWRIVFDHYRPAQRTQKEHSNE